MRVVRVVRVAHPQRDEETVLNRRRGGSAQERTQKRAGDEEAVLNIPSLAEEELEVAHTQGGRLLLAHAEGALHQQPLHGLQLHDALLHRVAHHHLLHHHRPRLPHSVHPRDGLPPPSA